MSWLWALLVRFFGLSAAALPRRREDRRRMQSVAAVAFFVDWFERYVRTGGDLATDPKTAAMADASLRGLEALAFDHAPGRCGPIAALRRRKLDNRNVYARLVAVAAALDGPAERRRRTIRGFAARRRAYLRATSAVPIAQTRPAPAASHPRAPP